MPATTFNADIQPILNLLRALNCGALLIDRSGVILEVNARLCTMMQRSAETLRGANLLELYDDPEARGKVQDSLNHFDERAEEEFYLPLPDNGRLPVIASARPAGAAPPLSEFRIVTLIDISRQKQAENSAREQYGLVVQMSDTLLQQALELKRHTQTLEQRVSERTAQLHEAHMDAIFMLAIASEAKDADTGRHVRRIARLAREMARRLGYSTLDADAIGYSAILHDVGKIHVPDDILTKPGPLDERERARMQLHTLAGERILSSNVFFDRARKIARAHHEEWDGSGYPDGLAGDKIPIEARIVHLVDVFDALTHERVYKQAWPYHQAVEAITKNAGRQFDPEIAAAFEKALADPAGRAIFEP